MIDHETGVAKDVPRPVEERLHRVLNNPRLGVLEAQQINRIDEH